MGENDDINDNMVQVGDDQDNLYTEAPIDPDKQTYILLKAPFQRKRLVLQSPRQLSVARRQRRHHSG